MASNENVLSVSYRTTEEGEMASEAVWTFKMNTLARLFESLRSVGYEARHHLPKRENQRQYIICGVFSGEEINSGDKVNLQIEGFSKHLLRLCDENQGWTFGGKFICKGRVAALLNNFGRHGEARLFDPDGTLLRQIGVTPESSENDITERHRYLDKMKERFMAEFGATTKCFIVLLSHLVPCTEEGHECARLIREYAEQTDSKIIVSYDNTWHGTNSRLSHEHLNHENIFVVRPRERRGIVNKEVRDLQREMRSSGLLKRPNSWENEKTDDLDDVDLIEVPVRKQRFGGKQLNDKRPTRSQPPVPGDSKKKRRSFDRQNSKSEYAQKWCRQNSQ